MDVKGDEENSHSRSGPPLTKQECFERSLFGLPSSQAHFVNKIKCGMVLFLFEYEEKTLWFPDAVKDNYYTKESSVLVSLRIRFWLLLLFSTRIKDSSLPSKSLKTSTEVMRSGKSGLGTVSVSGNGRGLLQLIELGLNSSEKHFPRRDDRDNQLMNTPYNSSYISEHPRYTSPDSFYLDCRSQIPATHLEPVCSIAQIVPMGYRSQPQQPTQNQKARLITSRLHTAGSDVRIQCGYHGNQDPASSNFETHPRSYDTRGTLENTFSSSFGLASGAGASPAHHLDYGHFAALPLEINDNPVPQLDYYSANLKTGTRQSLGYDYPTEDIKDYRKSVMCFSLNKVKGNTTENQHGKGNTGSAGQWSNLRLGLIHYQNRKTQKWHAARDDDNRNSKWHTALDDDNRNSEWHTARDDDNRNSNGVLMILIITKNDDLGDSKRNLGRFAVFDDDRDTSKGILRRSSSMMMNMIQVREIRDNIKKNHNRLTAPDNDHGSNKRNSGRSIARDEGHAKKAKIEDDNNLASEEENLWKQMGEEAPLVNYKRRSETGKGQQGSGLRGCVKGFDSEVVPGKKRKLVRPSNLGSVAGGEGIDADRMSNSDRRTDWVNYNDIEVGLSLVVATDCLLESKLDHVVEEIMQITENARMKTVDFCLKCISANDDRKVKGNAEKAVAKECLLTVHTPSQVAVVFARGRMKQTKTAHEALQNPVVGSVKTEIKGSRKVVLFESSGVECYTEEDLAQKLVKAKVSMLNGTPTIDAVEDLKEGKNHKYMLLVTTSRKRNGHLQDGGGPRGCLEGLKTNNYEVLIWHNQSLLDGSFEPQGKGTEIDLRKRCPKDSLLKNLLLNRQGLSQDTMVCDVSLQQTTKRGQYCNSAKGETVQEPAAGDSLQQLAEEPPCIETDKVNSEKTDAVTDGSLTCDGREKVLGKTDRQTLRHIIPRVPVFNDETTAKMVDEDDGCERQCKPVVSSVTMQSESEQRPLRRVKKVLKRVKKGTSNPSARKYPMLVKK
ncbi:hypothetical protein MKW92_025358 [Papaver armeniacum]|nr:hypothetical protein MKW92_025358 [Papaver armeniacum]